MSPVAGRRRPRSGMLHGAALGGLLAASATAQGNGHDLLAQCRAARDLLGGTSLAPEQQEAARYCLGYLRGITRIVVIGHLLKPGSQLFCPPENGIRTREAVAVVVDYLERFPERLGSQPITLAAAAFMRAWPCTPPDWPEGPPPVGLEDRWRPQ